jgi:hypothetical protein
MSRANWVNVRKKLNANLKAYNDNTPYEVMKVAA